MDVISEIHRRYSRDSVPGMRDALSLQMQQRRHGGGTISFRGGGISGDNWGNFSSSRIVSSGLDGQPRRRQQQQRFPVFTTFLTRLIGSAGLLWNGAVRSPAAELADTMISTSGIEGAMHLPKATSPTISTTTKTAATIMTVQQEPTAAVKALVECYRESAGVATVTRLQETLAPKGMTPPAPSTFPVGLRSRGGPFEAEEARSGRRCSLSPTDQFGTARLSSGTM